MRPITTTGKATEKGCHQGTRRRVAAGAVALLSAAGLTWAQGDPRFEEHLITSVPRGVDVDHGIAFTPDGRHVAYVGSKDGKSVPVIDATVFDPQWYVHSPRISADGRVAFVMVKPPAKRVQESWLLLDGKPVPDTDGIDSPKWSPDGRRLAYVADPECRIAEDRSRPGPFVLVVDGKKGSKWHGVDQLAWSRDSQHVVAVAEREKGGYCVLLDGKPFAEGARYDGPVFSPDGTRIAYACELVRNKTLAADFTRIKWFVACGKLRLGLDFDNAGSPVFSPDGKRIAFKAERAGRVGIAVDGSEPVGAWAFVSTPVFSDDGAHMAFAASADCTVAAGYLVTTIPGAGLVTGGSWQAVLDGRPSEEKFAEVRDLTFSPDGQRFAFRARTGPKWRVVCGAKKSEEFDFAGPPQFSPDGSRLAFGVQQGREFAWKVLAVEK
jgi:Tol biopolymer transport system component